MSSKKSRAMLWLKTEDEADLIIQPLIGFGILSSISIGADAEFYPVWHIHGFPESPLTTEEVSRITGIEVKLIIEWEQFYADCYSRQFKDRIYGRPIPVCRDLGINKTW